ncbi:MAG: hypothetical protein IK062_10100 [Selenomonadaceae bacterium]|nr:hypothetical protein [Selenomonadaceae bacterium]
MRKGKEVEKCINNARYLAKLAKLDGAKIQSAMGREKCLPLKNWRKMLMANVLFLDTAFN